jgi:uncharacterized low-complexity protein
MRLVLLLRALAGALALSACSSQQAASIGQSWQVNECNRVPDVRDREQCLERAKASADEYRRERQAAQKQP